jgi:phage terminase large subunit GpA-like protein
VATADRRWWPGERDVCRPPERLTVSECADRYRVLSLKAAKRGPWKTDFVPPVRAFADSFGIDSIEEIWLVKPTQTGGTDTLLNMILYAITQRPGDMLFVEPDEKKADEISTERIDDMIAYCDKLQEIKDPDPRKSGLKRKKFSSMSVYFGWSGSAASLASRPLPYVLFDEVDKYASFAGKEGSPTKLGRERTNTFKGRRKLVYISTPTLESGYISQGERLCEARFRYLISCPHCGRKQLLFFGKNSEPGGVRFEGRDPKEVLTGAWFEMATGLQFHEHIRQFKPKSVGFQFNRLYTPWFTLGEVAAEFLRCKDHPELLQNFVNSWLAEPWVEHIETPMPAAISHLHGDYVEGEAPEGCGLLTAAADVQRHYIQFAIRGWAPNGDSGLVLHKQVETFDELAAAVLQSEYGVKGTEIRLRVRILLVDSGYRTDEVYEFCRTHAPRARAIKGATHSLQGLFYRASRLDINAAGKKIPGGLSLWLIDTGYWKDFVARRMQPQAAAKMPRWQVYSTVDDMYAAQVTAEHKVTVRNRVSRKTTEVWQLKPGQRRNEAWDLEVYNAVAADMCGLKYSVARKQTQVVKAPRRVGTIHPGIEWPARSYCAPPLRPYHLSSSPRHGYRRLLPGQYPAIRQKDWPRHQSYLPRKQAKTLWHNRLCEYT